MKELEVIRKKTDELDDHPEDYVKAEVRKKGRTAGFIFLIVLAMIAGLAMFYFGFEYFIEQSTLRDNAREELEFRDRYMPELNRMVEEGQLDEAADYMLELYDKEGSSYLWNWEHYEYVYAYSDYVYVKAVCEAAKAGELEERDFLTAGTSVILAVKDPVDYVSRRVSAAEKEKIEAFREEEKLFLTEIIGISEEEIDEIYEKCSEDGWASYTDIEKELKKYWDRVPDELKKR